MSDHLVIPDTQVKPGLGKKQLAHLQALTNYINEYRPKKIIMLGDWWDMPSLSKYELAGSKTAEGRRIQKDIDAGNKAMDNFMDQIDYWPEFHFLKGNHEERLGRLGNEDVRFEGLFEDKKAVLIEEEFRRVGETDLRELQTISGERFDHLIPGIWHPVEDGNTEAKNNDN